MEQFTCLFDYFKGYHVTLLGRIETGTGQEYWLQLSPDNSVPLICGACGEPASHVHDHSERWISDLRIFEWPTKLLVMRRRLFCRRCGPKLEHISWLDRYSRVTKRLADSVGRLCDALPVKDVAEYYDLDWKTVRAIDKRRLQEKHQQLDMSGVTALVMDEFAIQKGHRYATVVIDPSTKGVLWVGRGRSRESVRPFFEQLSPQQRSSIKAVAMDMTAAYALEVQAFCPKARIVYDLFHVIAKYCREVLDRVRVDEANRLRGDKQARKVIKGSRWLLLRNKEHVTREADRIRLDELLQANQALCTAYIMKDELKQLWLCRSPLEAWRRWKYWLRLALESGIEPLRHFAVKLKDYASGIISHSRYALHTSVLEGINNTIKVIKRMAYGYRDDEYFFLKIKNAFPGNRR
jgi:transposase